MNRLKGDIEKYTHAFQVAEREGNFAKASEIKYGIIAKLEKELEQQKWSLLKIHPKWSNRMLMRSTLQRS